MKYIAVHEDRRLLVEVSETDAGAFVDVDGTRIHMDLVSIDEGSTFSMLIDGKSYTANVLDRGEAIRVQIDGKEYSFDIEQEELARLRSQVKPRHKPGAQTIKATMPGRVMAVEVAVGEEVSAGQGVVIIEAMKMENELKTHVAGRVKEIRAAAGDAVNKGDVLVVLEEAAVG